MPFLRFLFYFFLSISWRIYSTRAKRSLLCVDVRTRVWEREIFEIRREQRRKIEISEITVTSINSNVSGLFDDSDIFQPERWRSLADRSENNSRVCTRVVFVFLCFVFHVRYQSTAHLTKYIYICTRICRVDSVLAAGNELQFIAFRWIPYS